MPREADSRPKRCRSGKGTPRSTSGSGAVHCCRALRSGEAKRCGSVASAWSGTHLAVVTRPVCRAELGARSHGMPAHFALQKGRGVLEHGAPRLRSVGAYLQMSAQLRQCCGDPLLQRVEFLCRGGGSIEDYLDEKEKKKWESWTLSLLGVWELYFESAERASLRWRLHCQDRC